MQLHNNLHSTPGPFITQVAQTLANGHHLIQLSRRYRKRLPPLQLRLDGTHIAPALKQSAWLRFWAPLRLAWWIVVINLAGSVAFLIAAVYGFFPPSPKPDWVWTANLWTLIGALCFFSASYLMLPELFDADADQAVSVPATA